MPSTSDQQLGLVSCCGSSGLARAVLRLQLRSCLTPCAFSAIEPLARGVLSTQIKGEAYGKSRRTNNGRQQDV